MLTIYKTIEQGLEQIESMANGAWVKVVDPTPEEIEKLVDWGIDVDYINYSLDFDEMSRPAAGEPSPPDRTDIDTRKYPARGTRAGESRFV